MLDSKQQKADQPHARNYPGRKTPSAGKVVDAQHNQAAMEAGRSNSMGVSANGSHKGLPSNSGVAGKHVSQPAPPAHGLNYPGRKVPKNS